MFIRFFNSVPYPTTVHCGWPCSRIRYFCSCRMQIIYKILQLYNARCLFLVLLMMMNLQVLEQCVEQYHDQETNDGAENDCAPLLLVKRTFWQGLVHDSQNYRVQILQSQKIKKKTESCLAFCKQGCHCYISGSFVSKSLSVCRASCLPAGWSQESSEAVARRSCSLGCNKEQRDLADSLTLNLTLLYMQICEVPIS